MKKLTGKIFRIIDDTTVSVIVDLLTLHSVYRKYVKNSKKYLVHKKNDESFLIGEMVMLLETRPISKKKSYIAVKI